jgi:hypothetical protein
MTEEEPMTEEEKRLDRIIDSALRYQNAVEDGECEKSPTALAAFIRRETPDASAEEISHVVRELAKTEAEIATWRR